MKQMFSFAPRGDGLIVVSGLSLLIGVLSDATLHVPRLHGQQPSPVPSQVQRIQNGVQLNTAALNVKVQFYAADIVRVLKWLPGGTPRRRAWW